MLERVCNNKHTYRDKSKIDYIFCNGVMKSCTNFHVETHREIPFHYKNSKKIMSDHKPFYVEMT